MSKLYEMETKNGMVEKYRQFTVVIEDNAGVDVVALNPADAQMIALDSVEWFGGHIEVIDTTPAQKANEVYGVDSVDKANAILGLF